MEGGGVGGGGVGAGRGRGCGGCVFPLSVAESSVCEAPCSLSSLSKHPQIEPLDVAVTSCWHQYGGSTDS